MLPISLRTCLIVVITSAALFISPVLSEEDQLAGLPVYTAENLNLDTSKLRPYRLLYSPLEGVGGYEDGIFADGIFINPQISITLDRTVYYTAEKTVHDAIRIRWVANTHPHTDEIIVDATTLAMVNEQVRTGRNWETKNKVVNVRDQMARITVFSDEKEPSTSSFPLTYSNHYGLMALPYLFAAMDVQTGANFKLPAIGSKGESFIEIKSKGSASYIDSNNQQQSAQLYTSFHSWGSIDWYIDTENPPYHQQAIWYFGERGTPNSTAISKVIDWKEFDTDVYDNIINRELLRDSQ